MTARAGERYRPTTGRTLPGMTAADPAMPTLVATVLDSPRPLELARFYGALTGWTVFEDDDSWARVRPDDGPGLSVQLEPEYVPPTWPGRSDAPGMQLHLDFLVEDLPAAVARAIAPAAPAATEMGTNRIADGGQTAIGTAASVPASTEVATTCTARERTGRITRPSDHVNGNATRTAPKANTAVRPSIQTTQSSIWPTTSYQGPPPTPMPSVSDTSEVPDNPRSRTIGSVTPTSHPYARISSHQLSAHVRVPFWRSVIMRGARRRCRRSR